MANIILHQIQGIAVGIEKKDGYINATKLCTAYNIANGSNKRPSDWGKTDRAKRYIAYVSSVTNILVTGLVVIKQGQNHDEQGTWIHPDLAVPFATWLSVEFEYQVSQWIQEWNKNKDLNQFPQSVTGPLPLSPTEELVHKATVSINAIFKHVPEDLRTGMKVNKMLCDRGLQQKTGDKNPAYRLIGSGYEFGKVVADTAAGHGKTVQHVRWYQSVLEQLND